MINKLNKNDSNYKLCFHASASLNPIINALSMVLMGSNGRFGFLSENNNFMDFSNLIDIFSEWLKERKKNE